MRNLRAMLGFDVRNLAGLGWGALALLGLAIVLRIAGSFQTALPMLTTLGFITVLQPFTADALPGLRRLYVAAPVSRRTVIASHYLTGAAVYVVTVALLVVIALPWGDPALVGADEAMAAAVGAALIVGSLLASQIPFTVRFGSRAGIFLLLFLGGVGALIGWFTMDAHDERTSWIVTTATWLSAHPGLAVLAGAAVVVAQWLVSFVVSAAIFERKEL